jgi:hypothetical protein
MYDLDKRSFYLVRMVCKVIRKRRLYLVKDDMIVGSQEEFFYMLGVILYVW